MRSDDRPRYDSRPMTDEPDFTHLDAEGRARMVDVAAKPVTLRRAVARARIEFPAGVLDRLFERGAPKGSVTGAARIAGIAAAKKTWELIPLCHAIPLSFVSVDFEVCGPSTLEVTCAAQAEAKTGVEMEALTGASVAALTIYDMCKALSRGLRITELQLLEKSGGRSGSWKALEAPRTDPKS